MTLVRRMAPLSLLLMALISPVSMADEKEAKTQTPACCAETKCESAPVLSKIPYVWKLFHKPTTTAAPQVGVIKLSAQVGQAKYKGVTKPRYVILRDVVKKTTDCSTNGRCGTDCPVGNTQEAECIGCEDCPLANMITTCKEVCGACCKTVAVVKNCKCKEECKCDTGCKCEKKPKSVQVRVPQVRQYQIDLKVQDSRGRIFMQPKIVTTEGRKGTFRIESYPCTANVTVECKQAKPVNECGSCPIACPPCPQSVTPPQFGTTVFQPAFPRPQLMPNPHPIQPPLPVMHPIFPHPMPAPIPYPTQEVRVSPAWQCGAPATCPKDAMIEEVSQKIANRVAEILKEKAKTEEIKTNKVGAAAVIGAQLSAIAGSVCCEEESSFASAKTTLTAATIKLKMDDCGKMELTNGVQGMTVRCKKFKCVAKSCDIQSNGVMVLRGDVRLLCEDGSYKAMFGAKQLSMKVSEGHVEMELSHTTGGNVSR